MLAIETLLGALTGYFTNDIAIRQLFSKNGVVVREREQFTSLIVQVLKDKIIDAETIEALRDRPEMVAFFEEFVQELFSDTLPGAFSGQRLADYDTNGALQGLLKGRIADADLAEMALDHNTLYKEIDACVQQDAFKQAMRQVLQNIAACSLKDFGVIDALQEFAAPFEAMDDESWQKWLTEKQQWLNDALATETVSDESSQTMKALLSTDGETLVRKAEVYFGVDLTKPEQLEKFKDQFQELLEQLYVFSARVLPQVLESHLPAFIEAFYPMLADDREWIEQMILDSINECNTDGNMILSMAGGYVQNFFVPDEDGRDWFKKLYDHLRIPEERSVLCTKMADFLCGLIMQEIDSWRRLNLENEEDIQKVQACYAFLRKWAVKGAEAYLAMPVQGNKLHQALLKGASLVAFHVVRNHVSAEKMQRLLSQGKAQLLNQPLQALFLNERRQDLLVDGLYKWWQESGLKWLEQRAFNDKNLKQGLYQAVDELFKMPVASMIQRVQAILPSEPLADGLRMMFFSRLRGFLAGLTREQLDGLSHEEIREVVLDMIGREMRPLAYLGGGIGAVAGVATGAAMQASGVTVDSEQMALLLAARSGMYGAVGYGTNVMAVKGLFWPYKKTLGLQGLISKNQGRFANKMKSMAESYVINDEIWMQQVARVSERIGKHDNEILRYGLHLMGQHREKAVRPLVEMASQQLPHQMCTMLFDEKQVAQLMEQLAHKGIAACFNTQAITKLAMELEWFHGGVCKLAMAEATSRTWSEKILGVLHGLSDEKWTAMANSLLEHCHLPKKSGFYEKLWQKMLPTYRILPTLLMTYTQDIAAGLDRLVSNKLSFPLQLAYKMAGGDRQIERVVAHIIEYKLPEYVKQRETQVGARLLEWANKQFAGQRITACGISVSEAQGMWLADCAHRVQAEQLHQHMMALFVGLEKWPHAYVEATTGELVRFVAPILEAAGQRLSNLQWRSNVDWMMVSNQMAPILDIMRRDGFRNVSVATLMSVSDAYIWTKVDDMLDLTLVERDSIAQRAQGVWQAVAPTFWQAIGQRGRLLLMMVDIPSLTYERICALSPQELEGMIRDIAQPYFTRVERMGWLGAVVAVPATIISMMLGGM